MNIRIHKLIVMILIVATTSAAEAQGAMAPMKAMTPPAGGAAAQVIIKNFDYAPMDVAIPVGGSVTWKNLDGEPHTITSLDGAFRSGAIDQDETYTFKFDKPGVYKYLCSIHPQMRATITVK